MMKSICENLNENGFGIDSFFENENFFGNIVIQARLNCGIKTLMIKDRGVWECNVLWGKEEIPLVAVIYLMRGKSFEFEELSFNSDDLLIKWLITQKHYIDLLSNERLCETGKKWNALTKDRLKKMMGKGK